MTAMRRLIIERAAQIITARGKDSVALALADICADVDGGFSEDIAKATNWATRSVNALRSFDSTYTDDEQAAAALLAAIEAKRFKRSAA